MTDYRCPLDIAKNFDTEELAFEVGRKQHVAWIEQLRPTLRRGDRVEVFKDGKSVWWRYEPKN